VNVLLVVFDTARADALEPYGAPAGATPVVADLARRGVAHRDVFSTTCWTLPSHAALFGGALPRALGLAKAPGGNPLGARPVIEGLRDRWLPEVLRRAGWRTAAASANVWITPGGGWDTGFEQFSSVDSGRQARLDAAAPRDRARWMLEGARGSVDDGARAIGEQLRGWFAAWEGTPTFWFVNLVECHSPYLPPRPYGGVGRLARARAADEARRHLSLEGVWRACVGDFDVPDGALERMRVLYAGAVRYLDDWLAGVLEALDARGMLEQTLVVVTSDHGENFGEGGLLAHGWSLDDRLCRVPLVAAGPSAERLGVRSLAEIPAVLAGIAGLDGHPWQEELPPLAVAQFDVPGDGPDDPRLDQTARRWSLSPEQNARMREPLTSATDGTRKLVRRGAREELFDLASDPLEERPLDPGGHDVAALRAALDHPAAVTAATPGGPPPPGGADAEELARLEQQMKLLGYM
jgi:arylsulfatase A-like enzyme